MRHSLSKDIAFNGETTPHHTFLCSDLQCLPPGDPRILCAKHGSPITGKSFIPSFPGRQRCQMPGVCPGGWGRACWSFDLTDTLLDCLLGISSSGRNPCWGNYNSIKGDGNFFTKGNNRAWLLSVICTRYYFLPFYSILRATKRGKFSRAAWELMLC